MSDSKGKHMRLASIWNNKTKAGKVVMVSNRLTEDDSRDAVRLKIMGNEVKREEDRKKHWNEAKSSDADGHLIIEREHFDDLINYLNKARDDHDAYWETQG